MARTYRRKPWVCLRGMKTTNTRKGEYCSVMDLREEGYIPRNRHSARGNLSSKQIPDCYWDIFPNFRKEACWEKAKECKSGEICR